jgi:protein-S-isoprenylcysteine O-methyltransferase Ste14
VGGIISYLATPLALGSLWAFLPAAAVITCVVIRTALEDRTLQLELEGYADYVRRVRYRLLPGAW